MLSPIPRAPKRVSSLQTLPSQESNTGTGTGRGGVTIPRGRGRGLPPKPGGVTLTRSATTSEETSLEPATPSSPKQRKGLPPQPQRTSLARNLSCPDPDPNLPRPSRQTGDIPAITPPPSKSRTRCNYNTSPLPTHNNIEAAPVVDTQTSDSLAWLTGALGASTVQEQQASPAVSNPSSPAISTPPSPITSTSGTPAHDLSWLVAEEASSAPPSLEWLASDLSSPPNTQRIAAEPGLDGSSPMDWLSPEPERVSEPVPPEASSASLDWLAPPPPQQTGLDGDTGAVDNWWEASTPSPDTPAPADNWWESDPNLNSTKTLSLQNPEPSAEFGESNAAEVPGELLTSKSKPLPTPPSSRAYNRNSRPRSVARLQVRLNIPTPEGSPDSSTVMLKTSFKQIDDSLPPVIDVSQELFVVHPYAPLGTIPDEQPVIRWINDDFKAYFFKHDHYTFLGENPSNNDVIVVCVLRVPHEGQLLAIKITKKDHTMFRVRLSELTKVNIDFVGKFKNTPRDIAKRNALILFNHLSGLIPAFSFYHVTTPEITNFVVKIEEKHCQNNRSFKIGFLYSNGTEESPKDYFNHKEAPPSYWEFLDLLGTKISLKGWTKYRGDIGADVEQDSYYTVWKDIEVMFHICLWMNAEQHRRLIGNDVVFIIYNDSPKPLVPKPLDGLGTVPQVFCVVQPTEDDSEFYRLGTFTRPNIKTYDPPLCQDIAYHKSVLKDHLLTKVYNGYCEALQRPPMNRLFEVPRGATIAELVEKFPNTKKSKKKGKK